MTTFTYIALIGGREERGSLQADDERAARGELRARGMRVLALHEGSVADADGSALARWAAAWLPRNWMPVRSRDLIQFFRQAALMLRSGHTVLETLEATAQLAGKAAMRTALTHVARGVERGGSLSSAMAAQRQAFSPVLVRMVEAGEAGGELDQVMERVADDLERKADLRRALMAALTYPAVIILTSVLVVAFLIGGVIPKFASFLTARGKELPWAAADLLAIADFFTSYGIVIVAGVFLAVAALVVARTFEEGRRRTDAALLRLPPIGGAILSAGMAQLAWTLGMLLNSGLSVMEALQGTAAAMKNRALGAGLEEAGKRVLEGARLSDALAQPVVPLMARHMAAVGERSGELVAVMDQLGSFYRKDLEARIKLMMALIEPALILVVGGIVGFVYFAFFQALFTVGAGGAGR